MPIALLRCAPVLFAIGCATVPVREAAPIELRVHIEADNAAVRLQRGTTEVCGPPCDLSLQVRPTDEFRFAGEGVTPTEAFHFEPHPGARTLRVWAGSEGKYNGGTTLVVIGITGAIVSGVVGFLGTVANICWYTEQDPYDSTKCDAAKAAQRNFQIGGLIGVGVGIGIAALGSRLQNSGATRWESERADSPPK